MKKILYLAVVSAGLILSSCSMNKEAANLNSSKLQAKQELVGISFKKQELASVSQKSPVVQVNQFTAKPESNSETNSNSEKTAQSSKADKKNIRSSKIIFANMPVVSKIAKMGQNLVKPQTHTTAVKTSKSGGKSQIVALLLCIFLGGLGIHRFYLGYTGVGILELLTGGVFGILWLIDLIRIIMGDLKPKNGDYDEKF